MTQLSIMIALLAGLAFGSTDINSSYAVAGRAHIPAAATREASAEGKENSVAGTTPINWLPFH
jgi:hypothetical protein